jgi:osmotically-inducible protein OsmY
MASYYNRGQDWDTETTRYSRQNQGRNPGLRQEGSYWNEASRSRRYEDDYDDDIQRRRYTGRYSDEDYGSREYDRGYGAASTSSGRYYEGTYRPPDYGRDFDNESRYRRYRGQNERDWFDRASDEVASWFGDEGAERRRRYDELREAKYRGRGPRDYRRSDERIKEDINDRLTDHPYLDAYDVQVAVTDGEVTLSGTVNDRRDKRLAEDLAESVSGVKNVQNNLRVNREVKSEPASSMRASAQTAK